MLFRSGDNTVVVDFPDVKQCLEINDPESDHSGDLSYEGLVEVS